MKNFLTEYRKDYKFSQSYLAAQVNVSRQTIISIEKGKFNPSLELSFKLARVFNVRIDELFYYEEDKV
nr:helix-turn-helix transcriptional regulator [Halobacillus campisalis]